MSLYMLSNTIITETVVTRLSPRSSCLIQVSSVPLLHVRTLTSKHILYCIVYEEIAVKAKNVI